MPWHVINEELCDALAILVRKQMSQMQRASILAKMLGKVFVLSGQIFNILVLISFSEFFMSNFGVRQ